MKTTAMLALPALLFACSAGAQLKSDRAGAASASASLVRPSGYGGGLGSLFGLVDPDRFMMRHTLAYSYVSAGGRGHSVASYTNSMFYSIADPLDVRLDVTLQGSPFGSADGRSRDALSRISLSRAEINYRPWENVHMQVLYRELTWPYSANPFDPFHSGMFRGGPDPAR